MIEVLVACPWHFRFVKGYLLRIALPESKWKLKTILTKTAPEPKPKTVPCRRPWLLGDVLGLELWVCVSEANISLKS